MASGDVGSSIRRIWIRRFLAALLILGAAGAIARKSSPWISREIQLRLAERAIEQGRLADAEARLDLLVHEEPNRTRARLLLVQALRLQERITEAEEILQRTIEIGLPIEQGRREYALLSVYSDFPRAEKSLRRVLEAHPDDQEVRQALEDGLAHRVAGVTVLRNPGTVAESSR
jgi:tetratricopeptide (TPR) repeat protein